MLVSEWQWRTGSTRKFGVRPARRNGRLGFRMLTSARLKEILYAKSSQRCRLARRAGPDVVQRALEGNFA